MRTVLAIILALESGLVAGVEPNLSDPARLTENLGDEDYELREAATAELTAAGAHAIPALAAAIEREDPEVRARAFHILVALYYEGDHASHYAAKKELDKLALSQDSLGQQARAALRKNPVLSWILHNGGLCELDPEAQPPSVVTVDLGRTRGIDPLFTRDPLHDFDYFALTALADLRRLTLENRHTLTDAGLVWISRLRNLRSLNLSGTHIDGSGLKHLAELPHLRDLRLNNCSRFALEHFALLSQLSRLEALRITAAVDRWQSDDRWARRLRDVVSPHEQLAHMGTRDLAGYRGGLGDEQLQYIAALKELRELDLERTLVTDEAIELLLLLQNLEVLNLSKTRVTNAGLQHVSRLASLRKLRLNCVPLTDDGLAHLAACRQLEELELRGTPLTGQGFTAAVGLAGLRRLDLSLTRVDDQSVDALLHLTSLESLDLSRTKITAKSVEKLARLPKLRSLRLRMMLISDEVVTPLANMPQLQSVDLRESKLTFAGAIHLAEAAPGIDLAAAMVAAGLGQYDEHGELVYLNLRRQKLEDDDLKILEEGMHNLRYLDLAGTAVSDAGLAHLAKCPALVRLNLDETQVTDEGLPHLKSLARIDSLSTVDTPITPDAVFALIMSQGRGELTALKVAGLAE